MSEKKKPATDCNRDRLTISESTVMNPRTPHTTTQDSKGQALQTEIIPPPTFPDCYKNVPLDYTDPQLGAMNLHEAKEIVTISDLWESYQLPGASCGSCLSPFRRESNPSFSVYADDRRFKDHGTGDGGDVLDFLRLCEPEMDYREALERLIRIAQDKIISRKVPLSVLNGPRRYSMPAPEIRPKPTPPAMHVGSDDEINRVASKRKLTAVGLRFASDAGVLRFGTYCEYPCWFVLDASGLCIEARRIDGELFPAIEPSLPERKAHTLKWSIKSWPVGIAQTSGMPDAKIILVCEGGPDLLAAFDLCARLDRKDCCPVTILGRTVSELSRDALPRFAGKRVRIFPHADADGGGLAAAKKWGRQIAGTGATVDVIDLGQLVQGQHSVKDFNDIVTLCGSDVSRLVNLLP